MHVPVAVLVSICIQERKGVAVVVRDAHRHCAFCMQASQIRTLHLAGSCHRAGDLLNACCVLAGDMKKGEDQKKGGPDMKAGDDHKKGGPDMKKGDDMKKAQPQAQAQAQPQPDTKKAALQVQQL